MYQFSSPESKENQAKGAQILHVFEIYAQGDLTAEEVLYFTGSVFDGGTVLWMATKIWVTAPRCFFPLTTFKHYTLKSAESFGCGATVLRSRHIYYFMLQQSAFYFYKKKIIIQKTVLILLFRSENI